MSGIALIQPGGVGIAATGSAVNGTATIFNGEAADLTFVGTTTTWTWLLQSRPAGSVNGRLYTGLPFPPFSATTPGLLVDVDGVYVVRFTDSSATVYTLTVTVISEIAVIGGSGGAVDAATVAALRLVAGEASGASIVARCYRTLGDNGGGIFCWDAVNNNVTSPDDGGYTIVPTGRTAGLGAWKRQFDGAADIRLWGAIAGDTTAGATNDTAVASAIAYLSAKGGGHLGIFSNQATGEGGPFYFSSTISMVNLHNIHVEGHHSLFGSGVIDPAGTWIRVSSSFPAGGKQMLFQGCRSCSVERVGFNGQDNLGVYRAGRGLCIEAVSGAHSSFDVTADRCNFLAIDNGSVIRGFAKTSNLFVVPPAVTSTGLEAPVDANVLDSIPMIDVTTGGTLGVAKVKISMDLSVTWINRADNQVVTFTAATDKVNRVAHGYSNNNRVRFAVTGGTIAAGLDTTTDYFVVNKAADTFEVSLTMSGTTVNITGAGSGTQSIYSTSNETVADEFTTAASVSVPGSSPAVAFQFAAGTYSTDYRYEGEGYAMYVGGDDGASSMQVDTVSINNPTVNGCMTAYFQQSSQSVAMQMHAPNFACNQRGIVIHAGTFNGYSGQINNTSLGVSLIEVRAGALVVNLDAIYMEAFSGTALYFPSSTSRTSGTNLSGINVQFEGGVDPRGYTVDYEQEGPVNATGCTWRTANGSDVGRVSWRSPSSNQPVINEKTSCYLGGSILQISGVSYHDHGSRGAQTGAGGGGTFGDKMNALRNRCIAFQTPLTLSNDTAYDTSLPACGIYQEETITALQMTNIAGKRSLAVAVDDISNTSSILIRRNSYGGFAQERVKLGAVGSGPGGFGQALYVDGFIPTDLGAGLFVWLAADRNVTLGGTPRATGTTPPVVTLTGTGLQAPLGVSYALPGIQIEITTGGARGTALFKWSLDNGATYEQTGQTTAATFVLGTTNITANFPVGTYANNNVYKVTVSQILGQNGAGAYMTFAQAVAANQALYTKADAALNNRPSLNWEAGNTTYYQDGITLQAQPTTWWAVGKCTDQTALRMFFDNTSGATNRQYFAGLTSAGLKADIFAGTDILVASDLTSAGFACMLQYNGASSKIYRDGTLLLTGDANTKGTDGCTLGADQAGANNWQGSIGELTGIAGASIPTNTTRLLVDSYLRSKWATP